MQEDSNNGLPDAIQELLDARHAQSDFITGYCDPLEKAEPIQPYVVAKPGDVKMYLDGVEVGAFTLTPGWRHWQITGALKGTRWIQVEAEDCNVCGDVPGSCCPEQEGK